MSNHYRGRSEGINMSVTLMLLFCGVLVNSLMEGVNGDEAVIYVSPYDRWTRTGVRIVYRPQGFTSDSRIRKYYLRFKVSTSEDEASRDYSSGKELHWDTQGKYYYYESSTSHVKPHDVVGYKVQTYDYKYRNFNKFYYVPSNIEYCALDSNSTQYELKCSAALKKQAQMDSSTRRDATTTTGYRQTSPSKRLSVSSVDIVLPCGIGVFLVLLLLGAISCRRKEIHRKRLLQRHGNAGSSPQIRVQCSMVRASSASAIFTVTSERPNRMIASNGAPPSYHAAVELEMFDNKACRSHGTTVKEEEAKDAKTGEESDLPPLYEQLCLKCYVAMDSPLCKHNSSLSSLPAL